MTLPLARLRFCWSRPLPWVGMAVIPGLRAESRPTLGYGSPHLGTDPSTPPPAAPCQVLASEEWTAIPVVPSPHTPKKPREPNLLEK